MTAKYWVLLKNQLALYNAAKMAAVSTDTLLLTLLNAISHDPEEDDSDTEEVSDLRELVTGQLRGFYDKVAKARPKTLIVDAEELDDLLRDLALIDEETIEVFGRIFRISEGQLTLKFSSYEAIATETAAETPCYLDNSLVEYDDERINPETYVLDESLLEDLDDTNSKTIEVDPDLEGQMWSTKEYVPIKGISLK